MLPGNNWLIWMQIANNKFYDHNVTLLMVWDFYSNQGVALFVCTAYQFHSHLWFSLIILLSCCHICVTWKWNLTAIDGFSWQEMRELQELQRTFYIFLNVITTHDLSSVFLSPKSRMYLDQMMQMLLYASCSHKDIFVRKVRNLVVNIFSSRVPSVYCYWSLSLYTHYYTWAEFMIYSFIQACVQIIVRLIKDWCAKPYGEDKVTWLF